MVGSNLRIVTDDDWDMLFDYSDESVSLTPAQEEWVTEFESRMISNYGKPKVDSFLWLKEGF